MSVTATTANLLWSRARGLCSRCKRDLAPEIDGQATLSGFQAHITSRRETGPRYDSRLTTKQRNDYTNLILLCGSCHAEVDKLPNQFTVAALHAMKADHERFCADRLTADDETRAISGEILANAVDIVVEGLQLERWDQWTAEILNPGKYRWPSWALRGFRDNVRPAVEAVLWPTDAVPLEIASKMAVDAVMALHFTFSRYAGYEDCNYDVLVCPSLELMIDRSGLPWPENERALMYWDETLELGLVHLAKCVNWFAEAVRAHVAPRFRIRSGAFRAEPSKFDSHHGVYKFSSVEIARVLERGYVQPRKCDPWNLAAASWIEMPKARYTAADDSSFEAAPS